MKKKDFDIEETKFWIGFNFFEGIGPLRFKLLYDYFGSAQKAWQAKTKRLREIGLGEIITNRFDNFRQKFDPSRDIDLQKTSFGWQLLRVDWDKDWAANILDEKRKQDFWWVSQAKKYQKDEGEPICVLSWLDKEYPERLRKIETGPPVIYVKSKIKDPACKRYAQSIAGRQKSKIKELFDRPAVAVVGTRKMTSYGKQVVQILVSDLARLGIVIVSGMARGMDSEAHLTAINSGGLTIAVLGCGVDVIYPPENKDTYQKIMENGLIISEFPPGFPPLPGNFPARNRIISGLSDAVLVAEAAEKSGSLITASCALDQGKDVFAVPGPITSSLSDGTAKLIKTGAKLVSSINDILEELNIKRSNANPDKSGQISKIEEENLTEEEKSIWQCLENGEKLVDDIILETRMSADKVGGVLSLMSIKGIVIELGGGKWGRNS